MLFKDLMYIEYDRSGNILMEELSKILENTPNSVKKQRYSDHWRKDSFQESYRNIEISSLNRELKEVSAKDIIKCCHKPNFELLNTDLKNYNYTKNDSQIRKHREEEKTRMEPPVFINSNILESSHWLRLIEWHNRTWTLKGLIKKWLINPNSKHKIWYWKY